MSNPREIIRATRAHAQFHLLQSYPDKHILFDHDDIVEICHIATNALDELDDIRAQAEDATEYVLASMLKDEKARAERLARVAIAAGDLCRTQYDIQGVWDAFVALQPGDLGEEG